MGGSVSFNSINSPTSKRCFSLRRFPWCCKKTPYPLLHVYICTRCVHTPALHLCPLVHPPPIPFLLVVTQEGSATAGRCIPCTSLPYNANPIVHYQVKRLKKDTTGRCFMPGKVTCLSRTPPVCPVLGTWRASWRPGRDKERNGVVVVVVVVVWWRGGTLPL